MSIPAGSRISICDKEFNHYSDLAKHMKFILAEHLKGSSVMTKEHLIKSLKAFKKSLIFGQHIDSYEYLLKEKFHKVCLDLMKICTGKEDNKLLTALLSCIITITDNSKEMCEVLVMDGLPTLLINQTIRICDKNVKGKLSKSVTVEDLMAQIILIVDNVVSNTRFQEIFLQDPNISIFKQLLNPYLESKDERICILTMAALTYLIEEEEDKCRLDFYSNIISKFLDYIKRGMNDKDKRCNGLRVTELLAVVRSLSNIQSIKNTMLRKKSLMSLLQDILKSKYSETEEIQTSLGILYNLSFRDITETKEKRDNSCIQEVCKLDIIIHAFQKSTDFTTKRYADGLMSELSEKLEKRKLDIRYDVFISYCKVDRNKILKIANMLEKKGFKVWIDDGNHKQHSFEDIEQFIHQSRILVMGVSNSYYYDQCCRSECQLAYNTQKPIVPVLMEPKYKAKDWLRKMIHKELVLDFSNETEFDNIIGKLLKHIEYTLNTFGTYEKEKCQMEEGIMSMNLNQSMKSEKDVKLWSSNEVAEWLKVNNLGHLQQKSTDYDGTMLEYLRKMKNTAPEQYSKRLKEDLNLVLKDEIKFDEALEKLK